MLSLRSRLTKILNEALLTESLSSLGSAWLLKSILECYDFWDFTYIRSKMHWTAVESPDYKKQESSFGFPQLIIEIDENIKLAEEIWFSAEGKQLEWLENNFQSFQLLGELLFEFKIVLTQSQAPKKRGYTYFDGDLKSKSPKVVTIRPSYNKIVVSIDNNEQSLKNIASTSTPAEVSEFAIETLHTRTTMLHEFHHWIQGKVYHPTQKLPQFSNQPTNMKENFYQLIIQDLINLGGLEPADSSLPHHEKLYKIIDVQVLKRNIDFFKKQFCYLEEILLKKIDDMKKAWNNGTISQSEVEKLFTLVNPWFANKKRAFTRMRNKFLDKTKSEALTKTNRGIFARECARISQEMKIEFFIVTNDIYQKTNRPKELLKDGKDVYISYKSVPIRTDTDIRRGKTPRNKFNNQWAEYATELDAEIVTWLNQFILSLDTETLCKILLGMDTELIEQIKTFLNNNSLQSRFFRTNRDNNQYLLNKLDRIVQELIEVGMEFSDTAQNQVQWNLIQADIVKFQQTSSTAKFSIATTSFLNRFKKKIKDHFGI